MALTSSRQQNGSIIINSGDHLTIESATDFQRLLREGLEAARTVLIEFEPCVEIDFTGLQLICSACKTAAARGATFSCQGSLPQALDEIVSATGAERHAACKHHQNFNCIWFGGKDQCQK